MSHEQSLLVTLHTQQVQGNNIQELQVSAVQTSHVACSAQQAADAVTQFAVRTHNEQSARDLATRTDIEQLQAAVQDASVQATLACQAASGLQEVQQQLPIVWNQAHQAQVQAQQVQAHQLQLEQLVQELRQVQGRMQAQLDEQHQQLHQAQLWQEQSQEQLAAAATARVSSSAAPLLVVQNEIAGLAVATPHDTSSATTCADVAAGADVVASGADDTHRHTSARAFSGAKQSLTGLVSGEATGATAQGVSAGEVLTAEQPTPRRLLLSVLKAHMRPTPIFVVVAATAGLICYARSR